MEVTKDRKELLKIKQISKHFDIKKGLFKKKQILKAVDNVDLTVYEGETLGIVGESSCGKSTLGNMIMHLIERTSGEITFGSEDLSSLSKKKIREKRRDIQMIFQDPFSSLNPRMKIFDIIAEPLRAHKISSGKKLTDTVYSILEDVGLSPDFADRYPHQFSGGQRQRIGIGRALALRPKLIVCDEPVSALDVSVQSQILNLLMSLQERYQLTYMFIAHGLPAVSYISDRIAVMYLGKIVEIGSKEEIMKQPTHPYTEGLLASVPVADPELRGRDKILEGETPNPVHLPSGCSFYLRCTYATDKCKNKAPQLKPIESSSRLVACHYPVVSDKVLVYG
jgi:peptide/nickel transport system ATP-binding protein